MKILSQPDPTEWRGKATCFGCTTQVELEITDVQLISDSRDGSYIQWVCPVCRTSNTESIDKVPYQFRYALRQG